MYFFFFFSDVTRGSSLFENIFVSGGALLTDDVILKTIDIGNYSVVRSCDFHNWRKLIRKRQTAISPESASRLSVGCLIEAKTDFGLSL